MTEATRKCRVTIYMKPEVQAQLDQYIAAHKGEDFAKSRSQCIAHIIEQATAGTAPAHSTQPDPKSLL